VIPAQISYHQDIILRQQGKKPRRSDRDRPRKPSAPRPGLHRDHPQSRPGPRRSFHPSAPAPEPLLPISGRRPVGELLRRGLKPEVLLILRRERRGKEAEVFEPYRQAGWKIEEVERERLDQAAEGTHHQGVVALIRQFPYLTAEELVESAQSRESDPLVVVLDEIQDAGNLGAILRSAEGAGAAGAVIPLHRSAQVTAAVMRASAGAALHLPICREVNLNRALEVLREAGFRVFGADQEGDQSLYQTDLRGPAVLVIGSEGRGLRPGVKRRCDALVAIPLRGRVASLNASVAAALCLYEAVRQRLPG